MLAVRAVGEGQEELVCLVMLLASPKDAMDLQAGLQTGQMTLLSRWPAGPHHLRVTDATFSN